MLMFQVHFLDNFFKFLSMLHTYVMALYTWNNSLMVMSLKFTYPAWTFLLYSRLKYLIAILILTLIEQVFQT